MRVKVKTEQQKYCAIGGQAVIEGVMMRGKSVLAVSVRQTNGEIAHKIEQLQSSDKASLFKLPFLRGIRELYRSMVTGIRTLLYSAEFFEEEGLMEKGKFDLWLEKVFKEKAEKMIIGFSLVTALGLAILMFFILPAFLISMLRSIIAQPIILTALEGVLKLSLFIGYLAAISQMPDIKRVFEYHGAEHKTIHCFENGVELTPENAQTFTRLHPRCGTSFLLIVMVISIIVFSFLSWSNIWIRVGLKLLLLPFVAGLSYEIIKLAGRSTHPIMKAVSAPGLLLQRLTTREPDLKQLEVAIFSMKLVLENEKEDIQCEV